MYDCLRDKEMLSPVPEEQEKIQRKQSNISDKRDINVEKWEGS